MKYLLLAFLPALASCSALKGFRRPVTDVALGAAGAAAGFALGGDAKSGAIGAAGGVALGETLNHFQEKETAKSYADGYTHGIGDGVKRTYWAQRKMQEATETTTQTKLFEVPVPAYKSADGTRITDHTQVIEVVE